MKKSVLSGAALPISWHECSEHEPGEHKHTHAEDDIPGHPCPDQRLHDRAMDEFRRTRIGIAMFNTGIGLQDTLRQQRQEQEAMRDSAAKGRQRRAFRIDMNILMVARQLRERVHQLLVEKTALSLAGQMDDNFYNGPGWWRTLVGTQR